MYNTAKPYLGVVLLQFGYAGMPIIAKSAINQGMNIYTYTVYRNAIAALIFAPFAVFLERSSSIYFISLAHMYIFVCVLLYLCMRKVRFFFVTIWTNMISITIKQKNQARNDSFYILEDTAAGITGVQILHASAFNQFLYECSVIISLVY